MTLGTALAADCFGVDSGNLYTLRCKNGDRNGTMVNRITDFTKGGEDGDGYSYQSVQARIAVG